MSQSSDVTYRSWQERLPDWASRRLSFLVGSDFVRKVAETFVTRIALILIGLATSVIIARMLGPEGRGLQATIAAVTALGIQFGNLGLHSSNTYYVSRDPGLLPTLIGNSLLVSLGGTGLLAILAFKVFSAFPSLVPLDRVLLILALTGVPLGLAYLLLQNLLLGTQRIREYNRIELVSRVTMVALLVGLLLARAVSVEAVAVVGICASALAASWAFWGLRGALKSRIAISWPLLKSHLGYGFKAYLAALFAFTVLRADILMCGYLLGETATGHYSIAVSMADLVYMLPVVAGTIAFPKLVAESDPRLRWQKALGVAKWILVIMLAIAGVSAILAKPVVMLLFGKEYAPAVLAFLWLLPGIVLLGVNGILMNYFAAEGMPPIAIWSPAVASIINIGLNLVLLSRLGIQGASIASTVAYAFMLCASMGYIQVRSRRGVQHGGI